MTTTGPMDDGFLTNIPGELIVKAQQDMGFALQLLHRETREAAVRDSGLELSEEQLSKLHDALDKIAYMSFQEALEALRDVGVTRMM